MKDAISHYRLRKIAPPNRRLRKIQTDKFTPGKFAAAKRRHIKRASREIASVKRAALERNKTEIYLGKFTPFKNSFNELSALNFIIGENLVFVSHSLGAAPVIISPVGRKAETPILTVDCKRPVGFNC